MSTPASMSKSPNPVTGLCRLTVRAPARTIDLAVPVDVPVADLLPTLLGYGGEDLAEQGVEHEGWVLQRLGGRPLDPEATPESLDLHDGDTVYLRPCTETLPEVRLDDLVAGISGAMGERPYSWSPAAGRRLLRGLTVLVLLAVLALLALPGGNALARAGVAGGIALLLLAGAAAASRAVGDAVTAAGLGLMAGPFLALAGWLLPGGSLAGPGGYGVAGARLLAASAAEAGGAVAALAVVAAFPALFLAPTVCAVAGALAGVLLIAADFPPEHAAGVVALAAVLFGAFVPALSFRLAGLRMPPLPSSAEQLQEGIEPHSPAAVAARAALADGWMTALYAAAGLVCTGCIAALAHHADPAQELMTTALSLTLLLHSSGLGNALQRISLTVPGVGGLTVLAVLAAARSGGEGRLLLAGALTAGAACLVVLAWTLPGRRLAPYWGRAAEILHTLAAVSLLPLALWVLGVFGELRAIG